MEPEVILVALLEALNEGAEGLVEELAGGLRELRWVEPLISAWRADAASLRFSTEAMVRWFDEVALPTVRADGMAQARI
jgi:hypothetical protein